MSRFLLLLSVVIFSGCAIVPESIDVPDGTQLVSYSKAVTSGANAQGQKARWGGLIVGVENKPNKTLIELAHFPLNHYGKPNSNGETIGRFKVQIDGFVDPIVFEEGREATFLGALTTPTAGMVGEQPYIYPTIIADDYHMWRRRDVYDVDTFAFNSFSGWYSPFWGAWDLSTTHGAGVTGDGVTLALVVHALFATTMRQVAHPCQVVHKPVLRKAMMRGVLVSLQT
ncbi:Slp family lipoprotein [Alteromonas gracilis]|uniref:Slp family lipoprotein n=1 Tax=Alteromonas gracilis TaxID=1479524 RepID=UPI00321AA6F4